MADAGHLGKSATRPWRWRRYGWLVSVHLISPIVFCIPRVHATIPTSWPIVGINSHHPLRQGDLFGSSRNANTGSRPIFTCPAGRGGVSCRCHSHHSESTAHFPADIYVNDSKKKPRTIVKLGPNLIAMVLAISSPALSAGPQAQTRREYRAMAITRVFSVPV